MRIVKILGGLFGFGALGIGGLLAYYAASWPPIAPDTPLPDIHASQDPEVVARGEYLVESLAHCGACHSPTETYTGLRPGESSSHEGGHEWKMGPLGTIRSANITPDEATGIGGWTDPEIARAIRYGVGRDGRGLLFMMAVGPMSDEDLTAVISYLRSLPAVSNEIPDSDVGLMGKVLFQTAMSFFTEPHDYMPWMPSPRPAGELSVERGEYVAFGPAGCVGCHSQMSYEGGFHFDGQPFSGNGAEPFPDETEEGMEFAAPNLTPDPETGHITGWSEEQFLRRFRETGRVYAGSPMPWETYRNMSDEDLHSLWLFLRSLPPTPKLVGPARREAGWSADG